MRSDPQEADSGKGEREKLKDGEPNLEEEEREASAVCRRPSLFDFEGTGTLFPGLRTLKRNEKWRGYFFRATEGNVSRSVRDGDDIIHKGSHFSPTEELLPAMMSERECIQ